MQMTRFQPAMLQGALILICLLLVLPGLGTLPPIDRDEARFAQASKQMLESGDYGDIRFQDQPRYQKPAGIYWLQSASVRLSGATPDTIWPYRVPSVIGAVLAVLFTFRIGSLLFQPATGLLGGLLLAFSLVLSVEARLAKTDAVLLACVLGSHYLLALAYRHRGQSWRPTPGQWALGWLALAMGMLIKGPAILIFLGLSSLAVSAGLRSWRWLMPLRPIRGGLLVLLITLPWPLLINWQSEGRFLQDSLVDDVLAKVISAQESHGAPPGTHFVVLWAAFWPGSLLLSLALPWVWGRRRHPGVRFCLAWILPAWLLFELMPTKLPHYLLPVYPALAILSARAWLGTAGALAGTIGYRRLMHRLWLGLGTLPPLLVLGAYLYLRPAAASTPLSVAACGMAAAAVAAILAFGARSGSRLTLGMLLGGSLLFYGVSFQWLLPAMQPLWISRSVTNALTPAQPNNCQHVQLMSVGYQEPSLVFLAGTDTLLINSHDPRAMDRVSRHLREAPCRAALLPKEMATELTRDIPHKTLERIQGINYSKGRNLDLQLLVPAQ
jgi:4-amino-4-deoxy-L-arabinose transferase-like glycosyltransferase